MFYVMPKIMKSNKKGFQNSENLIWLILINKPYFINLPKMIFLNVLITALLSQKNDETKKSHFSQIGQIFASMKNKQKLILLGFISLNIIASTSGNSERVSYFTKCEYL